MFSNKQFGFRNKRSTTDAIVETLEVLIKSKNTDELTHCTLLDLSKAFDTVDHNNLIHKCHLYMLWNFPLNLLKSHLTNRNQYVFLSNKCSTKEKLHCIVPNGSVLGPLFFSFISMIFPIYLPKNLKQTWNYYPNGWKILSLQQKKWKKWSLMEQKKLKVLSGNKTR